MTGADRGSIDPREAGTQLRPGLWHTINERYPGSMIEKADFVPLAEPRKPLFKARLTMISSCGVHAKSDPPLDVCHPFGDFGFRRVPSRARHADLNHPSTEISARRCRSGHQRHLSDRTLAGIGR